ncbi:MAG: phage holin family protein [Bacteroidota bacterium]
MTDRTYTPLTGLHDLWALKLALTGLGTALIEIGSRVVGIYETLVHVEPLLIAAVFGLVALDFVTGLLAAKKRGEPIRSRAMRRTGFKFLEYAALILAASFLTNAFAASPLAGLTALLQHGVILYIALTEMMSILENVTGSRAAALRVWGWVRGLGTQAPETLPPPGAAPPDAIPPPEPTDTEAGTDR